MKARIVRATRTIAKSSIRCIEVLCKGGELTTGAWIKGAASRCGS